MSEPEKKPEKSAPAPTQLISLVTVCTCMKCAAYFIAVLVNGDHIPHFCGKCR